MSKAARTFSEREFYLAEFRRRSIGFAWPADEPPETEALAALVAELVANQTRVILMSSSAEILESSAIADSIDLALEDFAPRLWRALRSTGFAGLQVSAERFEEDCQRAAIELRLAKVVWIQSVPPVFRRAGNGRVSVVDLAHLGALLDTDSAPDGSGFEAREERRTLLEAIREMIRGGVPAVNVCAGRDVSKELLTYAGAGMFFTRDRYAEVRKLALDDFDPANDLLARGEADGYLLPRDAASRDAILCHAVGLFIEGRYLAGIGAIVPHPAECAAEVAALYALTRYAGEGVGSQIIRHAIERARHEGLAYVFSCTTSDRVAELFRRYGFRDVGPDSVPEAKWRSYDPERRARVLCLRFDP